jgi:hypothetical protein
MASGVLGAASVTVLEAVFTRNPECTFRLPSHEESNNAFLRFSLRFHPNESANVEPNNRFLNSVELLTWIGVDGNRPSLCVYGVRTYLAVYE